MTIKEAYHYGIYFLSANGVDEAEFKSLCLVCHAAGIKNGEFHLHQDDEIMMNRIAALLWRVKDGQPLQYIIGKWDFYESEFFIGEGVLIPRPETEELTHLAVTYAKKIESPVIFDLCAGSGCIGVSVAKKIKKATVYLIEKSEKAFYYLQKNCEGIGNVKPILGDITKFHEALTLADMIISNPPYIKTSELEGLQAEVQKEPMTALDGGFDGLDFYRIINDNWSRRMRPGGRLLLEIGEGQGSDIKRILSNYSEVEIIKDIYKNDRMVSAINKKMVN